MSNANDFIIENGVLKKYVGPGGAVIVPEEVTEIGIKAFVSGGYQVSSTITSIQLPRGVTAIRLGAFCGCSNLRSITMHPGVTIDRDYSGRKVGAETFGDCRSIKEIVFAKDCDDAVLDQLGVLCCKISEQYGGSHESDYTVLASKTLSELCSE